MSVLVCSVYTQATGVAYQWEEHRWPPLGLFWRTFRLAGGRTAPELGSLRLDPPGEPASLQASAALGAARMKNSLILQITHTLHSFNNVKHQGQRFWLFKHYELLVIHAERPVSV